MAAAIRSMAADKDCTPAQLALAWVLVQGEDVVPIPGTRRIANLEENVSALRESAETKTFDEFEAVRWQADPAALAEEMGSDKKTAVAALDAISALVSRTVAEGGALTLPGIGKIACRARPERQVRNPQTQEMMQKPADKVVKVTIAKALKDSVNA